MNPFDAPARYRLDPDIETMVRFVTSVLADPQVSGGAL